MKLYLQTLKRTFDYKGRSNRKEFWSFVAINLLIYFTLFLTDVFLKNTIGISNIYFSVMCIPLFTLSVRRVHDLGRSSDIIVLYFLPVLGWVYLFFVFIKKGDSEENKYGLAPDTQ